METIYLNSQEVHTCGLLPAVGSPAPDFSVVTTDLCDISLSEMRGKRIVMNIFPSLDTDTCARSVRRFNELAASMENTAVLCISKDLPFAAKRFCVTNGIDHAIAASAFRSNFGYKYGVELTDSPLRQLLTRAIIVVDEKGYIMATALSKEISEEPDYDYIINILKSDRATKE